MYKSVNKRSKQQKTYLNKKRKATIEKHSEKGYLF